MVVFDDLEHDDGALIAFDAVAGECGNFCVNFGVMNLRMFGIRGDQKAADHDAATTSPRNEYSV